MNLKLSWLEDFFKENECQICEGIFNLYWKCGIDFSDTSNKGVWNFFY